MFLSPMSWKQTVYEPAYKAKCRFAYPRDSIIIVYIGSGKLI